MCRPCAWCSCWLCFCVHRTVVPVLGFLVSLLASLLVFQQRRAPDGCLGPVPMPLLCFRGCALLHDVEPAQVVCAQGPSVFGFLGVPLCNMNCGIVRVSVLAFRLGEWSVSCTKENDSISTAFFICSLSSRPLDFRLGRTQRKQAGYRAFWNTQSA